jgi:hypothetical protein
MGAVISYRLTNNQREFSPMQPTPSDNPTVKGGRRRHRAPDAIALPDGEVLVPRRKFAEDLGISERTLSRLDLPTTFVGGIAYCKQKAGLKIIGDSAQRRNRPQKRRRA